MPSSRAPNWAWITLLGNSGPFTANIYGGMGYLFCWLFSDVHRMTAPLGKELEFNWRWWTLSYKSRWELSDLPGQSIKNLFWRLQSCSFSPPDNGSFRRTGVSTDCSSFLNTLPQCRHPDVEICTKIPWSSIDSRPKFLLPANEVLNAWMSPSIPVCLFTSQQSIWTVQCFSPAWF